MPPSKISTDKDDGPPGDKRRPGDPSRRGPGKGGRSGGGSGPKEPAGAELASWLSIVHPAYIKYIVALGILGLVMAALAFFDLQLLERLIFSLFPAQGPMPDGQPVRNMADEPFLEMFIRVATIQTGIGASIVILALYCPVLLLRAFVLYVNRLIIGRLELASRNDLEREVLRNLLRKDDQFFQENSVSVVTSRLGQDGEAIAERRQQIAEIWIYFVTVAGYFVFFITRNGFTEEHFLDPNSVLLTVLGFGSITVGIVLTNILGRHIKEIRAAMLAKDDAVKAALEDNLTATPEIQVGNLHNRIIAGFEGVQDKRVSPFLHMIRFGARMGVNYQLTYLVSFVVFVYAAVKVQAGASQDITTYVTLIIRILPEVFRHLAGIATALLQMNIAQPSVARLLQYASRPVQQGPDHAPVEGPPEPAAVTMKGVTYRFTPQGPLQGGKKGIDLKINPQSLVAIVGGSGSGKTMLSQLILGRLPVESGIISFGERQLPDLRPEEKAMIFAYMPQSNALLDTGIKENLLFVQRREREPLSSFNPDETAILQSTGVATVVLHKALEMYPRDMNGDGISSDALTELRTSMQDSVTKALGVDLVRLGPGQAAPNHPILDHLLGGAADKGHLLGLMQSGKDAETLAKLAGTPFGSGLIELALKIIDSTRELLSSCEDVEAYNRIAPYPLDDRVWEMRARFADMPKSFLDAPAQPQAPGLIGKILGAISGGPGQRSPRLPLMILGLLSCPNEFDSAWTPASTGNGLPQPGEDFIAPLEKLLSEVNEPFQPGRINSRLCWRDNLLFGAPTSSNSRLQTEIDAILLDKIADHPLGKMLMDCGYSYRAGRQGRKLSGGQRQRVCLGRAMLQDVRVFILDEPTSALDPQGRRRVNDYLKERAASSTIIAITHDRDLAEAADQVLLVHDGRLIAAGAFDELMKQNEEFRSIFGGS